MADGKDRVESATDIAQAFLNFYKQAFTSPNAVISETLKGFQEIMRSFTGASTVAPIKGDKRFRDPVWTTNPAYRIIMQSYLTWVNGINAWVDQLDLDNRDKLRAKLLTGLFTDTFAPTNTLIGNPTAMKVTLEHGGQNLLKGLQTVRRRHEEQQRFALDGGQVEVYAGQEHRAVRGQSRSIARNIWS